MYPQLPTQSLDTALRRWTSTETRLTKPMLNAAERAQFGQEGLVGFWPDDDFTLEENLNSLWTSRAPRGGQRVVSIITSRRSGEKFQLGLQMAHYAALQNAEEAYVLAAIQMYDKDTLQETGREFFCFPIEIRADGDAYILGYRVNCKSKDKPHHNPTLYYGPKYYKELGPWKLYVGDKQTFPVEEYRLGTMTPAALIDEPKPVRAMSHEELARANAEKARNGRIGEELVNALLAQHLAHGTIASYVWHSNENAIARFDFEAFSPLEGHRPMRIEVKTTLNPFDTAFHMSINEIIAAASGDAPYHIFRVFGLKDGSATLRMSRDIRPLARRLKDANATCLPAGIRIDGFSILPSTVDWEPAEGVLPALLPAHHQDGD